MSKKVLIFGVNGFIGSHLSEELLKNSDYDIYGMDKYTNKISQILSHKRFHFFEGDISINHEWIAYHVQKCDVIIPLVAIATPSMYVTNPLNVFELDFEANLSIVRQCVRYQKRLIFPSTSEVYGMCSDDEFDEETSNFVLGPINKQRWIYSASKQLLDRIIYAYGIADNLDYTLFRPFNWIGPKLDGLMAAKEGSSRVLTQFIGDLLYNNEIKLIDGGHQRRSFTDIADGIDGLIRIIENKNNIATKKIYNLGNPKHDISMKDLAGYVIEIFKKYKKDFKPIIREINSSDYYGKSYQDIERRVPSINKAKQDLNWEPRIDLQESLEKTIQYYILEHGSFGEK